MYQGSVVVLVAYSVLYGMTARKGHWLGGVTSAAVIVLGEILYMNYLLLQIPSICWSCVESDLGTSSSSEMQVCLNYCLVASLVSKSEPDGFVINVTFFLFVDICYLDFLCKRKLNT